MGTILADLQQFALWPKIVLVFVTADNRIIIKWLAGQSIGIGIASRKRSKPALTLETLIIRVEFKAVAEAKANKCYYNVMIPVTDEFRQSE
jgi:hypothetical protein